MPRGNLIERLGSEVGIVAPSECRWICVDLNFASDYGKEMDMPRGSIISANAGIRASAMGDMLCRANESDHIVLMPEIHLKVLKNLTPRADEPENLKGKLGVTAGKAAEEWVDVRAMYVDYDAHQERHKPWKDVVAECSYERHGDCPIQGVD